MAGIDKTVKLLLHGNGSDNGTTITDSSLYIKSISRYGNTCTKTGTTKFGTASIYFDGTGDYLTAPDHADWYFNQDDFCIDLWVNFSSLPGSNTIVGLINQYSSASVYWRLAYIDVSGTKSLVFQNNGTTICTYTTTFTTGQWYHIAVSRQNVGGTRTTRLFIDGSVVHSVTTDYTVSDIGVNLYIGSGAAAASYFTGYIDELRICHYEAKYTGAFTPPTEEYTLDTVWYIDPVNGNDNLSGTSWSYPWKSLKYGASSIVPAGHSIRMAKTDDPVSIGNATWTHDSATVTLASALTQDIDLCESGWTAATNVTVSYDATYRKQGSYALKLLFGSSFTTGKAAYKTLPSTLDLSSYDAISFWIRGSVTFAGFGVQIKLCSDSTGDTPVNTFSAMPSGLVEGSYWNTRRIDNGSALGSSINSVAIYVTSDPGTLSLYVDNIMACNDFSLVDLITKKVNDEYEAWYGIRSISGTTVILDNSQSDNYNTPYGYYGTSATTTTYRRTPHIPALADEFTISSTGSEGSPITIRGGYNTSSNTIDGETYVNGQGGQSSGFLYTTQSYLKIYDICPVGCYSGIALAGDYCEYYAHSLSNHSSSSITVAGIKNIIDVEYLVNLSPSYNHVIVTGKGNTITVENVFGANSAFQLGNGSRNNDVYFGVIAKASGATAFYITGGGNRIFGGTIKDSAVTTGAIYFYGTEGGNFCEGITFENITTNDVYMLGNSGQQILRNCTFSSDPPNISCSSAYHGTSINTTKNGGDIDNNKVYSQKGTIESQTSVRHTASGVAWKISPTSTTYTYEGYPMVLPLARVACVADVQVTVSAWFRRTNTGLTAKLVCLKNQLSGISTDVTDSMTANVDTWEQLSISFTPTESGVVQIEAQVYGGNTYSVYVDDLTIS